MEKYELYGVAEKSKGLQIHVYEKGEKCIRMFYVNPETLKPIQDQYCPEHLEMFITNHKEAIQMKLTEAIAV